MLGITCSCLWHNVRNAKKLFIATHWFFCVLQNAKRALRHMEPLWGIQTTAIHIKLWKYYLLYNLFSEFNLKKNHKTAYRDFDSLCIRFKSLLLWITGQSDKRSFIAKMSVRVFRECIGSFINLMSLIIFIKIQIPSH